MSDIRLETGETVARANLKLSDSIRLETGEAVQVSALGPLVNADTRLEGGETEPFAQIN